MITSIFILGHLAADFLFQPSKLVAWKERSWLGVLVHVLVLLIILTALFVPYLNQGGMWIGLAVVVFTHFVQDWLKVWYDKKFNTGKNIYPFFIDQFFHIGIIIFVSGYLGETLYQPVFNKIYFNENIYVYLSLLILFSYALDIVIYQIRRRKNPDLKYKRRYDYMSKGLLAFAMFYIIFLLAGRSL
ncbi:MAG: hypothetical protein ACD_65C00346G0007 [uncultured bacterium]|nr:MAG: hypothetical protein ACD_65C00346G0007 [uncultured bacterium]KKT02591.1 MAG: hypothetical protein UV80_C0002G0058 [Candidatus Peregrinibacteria bacterium GW2011_GWF2_43_17]KKT20586.1 MAG: hypothetical protein UW03_C0002G0052 [Candidatus Peregrinibacteria bacterium GW2011_GWA2_43_8]HAU39895.1 hypothetical protein [Candidatus Peregrinibacteria bacterium]